MESNFQCEAMHIQVRLIQAVQKAVCDVAIRNQGVQNEVRSKFSTGLEIGVSIIDDACEESALEVRVRLKDVCSLDEPILQMGSSARVVWMTGDEC